MRRALLIVVMVLAGCGEAKTETVERTTTAEQTPAETLKRTGDTLSATLQLAAEVLDDEDCRDEEQIRALTRDTTEDLDTLEGLKDEPALAHARPEILDGIQAARVARDGMEEILVAC